MMKSKLLFAWLFLATAGCAALIPERRAEQEAERHISLAESLEKASSLKEATREYALVAENYPSTRYFPEAVRKAALLYTLPSNPAANESEALRWLQTYLTLPISEEEKHHVRLHMALVRHAQSLKDRIARERSLRENEAKDRETKLSALSRQIRELEAALERATADLEKLKQVDVDISRARLKK